MNEGLNDLDYLVKEMKPSHHRMEKFMQQLDKILPESVTIDNYYAMIHKFKWRERVCYLAHCFVEAHEIVQTLVAKFVGDDETIDTPEEALVIGESRRQVEYVKKEIIANLRSDIVTHIQNKRLAR